MLITNPMTIHERFPQMIEALRLGQNEFARAIGMSTTGISNISRGVSEPSPKTLRKICEVFPQVNYAWLTTGEGEILLDTPVQQEKPTTPAQMESAVLTELREMRKEFGNLLSIIKNQQDLLRKPTGNRIKNTQGSNFLMGLVHSPVAVMPRV